MEQRLRSAGRGWEAASRDRGSIRRYGRDVRTAVARPSASRTSTRVRRPRVAGPPPSEATEVVTPTDEPRLKKQPQRRRRPASARRRGLIQEDCQQWSVDGVVRWLGVLGLERYSQLFRDNEIDGEVLLELGTDDLDYLDIRVLGHRKILLKGVSQLRAAVGLVGDDDVEAHDSGAAASSPARVGGEPKESAGTARFHWSQAGPLPAAAGTDPGAPSSVPVNPADGVLDEEAEHQAFRQAVMEWRNGGRRKEDSGTDASSKPGLSLAASVDNSAGAWSNRRQGGDAAVLLGEAERLQPSNLLQGELDEDAEHAAFRSAVEEWRRGQQTAPAAAGSQTADAAADADQNRHEKVGCYHCLRLFFRAPGKCVEADGHEFCSQACAHQFKESRAKATARPPSSPIGAGRQSNAQRPSNVQPADDSWAEEDEGDASTDVGPPTFSLEETFADAENAAATLAHNATARRHKGDGASPRPGGQGRATKEQTTFQTKDIWSLPLDY